MTTLMRTASLYQGLIYNVFQQRRDSGQGLVICFTACTPGEGVTHIVRALADELGEHAPHRVARVDLSYLQTQSQAPKELAGHVAHGDPAEPALHWHESGLHAADAASQNVRSTWRGSLKYREDCIGELRAQFQYVLIDCPALRTGSDVLSVAPLVDGVILVVEADRTTAEQVQHAERQIEAAGGKLSGHILNKRKYVVPQWLYKRLAS